MLAKNNLKRIHHFILVAVALLPLAALSPINNTAQAATTTTKYLNGKIVFGSDRSGDDAIYTMNPDGSNPVAINSDSYGERANWSPDGTKVAFIGYDNYTQIFSMNADGSNLTSLTNNTNSSVSYYNPTWSPDGNKISYISNPNSGPPNYYFDIYTMNPDGSNKTSLVSAQLNFSYNSPSWSPDSTKLVFTRYVVNGNNLTAHIYSMNADGTNQVALTSGISYNFEPVWSPDGSKIVYYYSTDSGGVDIFMMDSNGNNKTNLTHFTDPTDITGLDWSPDSNKIAFSSIVFDSNYNYISSEVYVMDNNGSNLTQVSTPTPAVFNHQPTWSPDGNRILYSTQDNNGNHLFTINPDGSNKTPASATTDSYDTFIVNPWQKLPYTVTIQDDGSIVSTISSDRDYSSTDYTIAANETLVLDGTLCDITVSSGGTLQGTGSIAPNCTLTVEPGGILTPGHSPGCLASGNLVLSGAYQAELAGTTACTGYDQLQVTGTVNLTGSTLIPILLNGFVPKAGDSFTLITNDGSDPVTGTFTGLPEGATVTVGSTVFKISYIGGDGNDVVLTAQVVPGSPETGYEARSNTIGVFLLGGVIAIGAIGLRIKAIKSIKKASATMSS